MTNDNQFDALLHDALGEYREAEPLAGIESRILARIHADASGRKSLGLRWAIALACAAAVVLAIWLGVGRRTPHPAIPSRIRSDEARRKSPCARTGCLCVGNC